MVKDGQRSNPKTVRKKKWPRHGSLCTCRLQQHQRAFGTGIFFPVEITPWHGKRSDHRNGNENAIWQWVWRRHNAHVTLSVPPVDDIWLEAPIQDISPLEVHKILSAHAFFNRLTYFFTVGLWSSGVRVPCSTQYLPSNLSGTWWKAKQSDLLTKVWHFAPDTWRSWESLEILHAHLIAIGLSGFSSNRDS